MLFSMAIPNGTKREEVPRSQALDVDGTGRVFLSRSRYRMSGMTDNARLR